MLKLPVCPHCHTVYSYGEVCKIAKEKSHTCYHCKKQFRPNKAPCAVLIAALVVIAVAANVGALYMTPNLNFYTLVGINIFLILIAFLLYPMFVAFKKLKEPKEQKMQEKNKTKNKK